MLKVMTVISFLLATTYADEIINELNDSCNTTLNYKLDDLYQIDNTKNESFPNPCNLSINAASYKIDGFILRIDFKNHINSNLFNISDPRIKDSSSNVSKSLIGSTKIKNNSVVLTVLSNYFQISFKDLSSKDLNLSSIVTITFTSFNFTNANCSKPEIECELFPKTCYNINSFNANLIFNPCLQDSSNSSTSYSTTTSTETTSTTIKTSTTSQATTNSTKSTAETTKLTSKTTTNLAASSTIISSSNSTDFHIIEKKSYNYIALVAFVLLLISACIVGVIIYGRRKRRWREFLAQLDNNTDWEYEQLEDMPIGSSDRYATVYDRTISASDSDRERENSNNMATRNQSSLHSEQTPIATSST